MQKIGYILSRDLWLNPGHVYFTKHCTLTDLTDTAQVMCPFVFGCDMCSGLGPDCSVRDTFVKQSAEKSVTTQGSSHPVVNIGQ